MLTYPALVNNIGMGGIGISSSNGTQFTTLNPALLYKNTLTVFDAALASERVNISNGTNSIDEINGGLAYLGVAFPVIPTRWTFSLGLNPYSTVGYRATETRNVQGAEDQTAELSSVGTGGINQVYISNGVKLFNNFALGLKTAFLFGNTNDETSFFLPDIPQPNYKSTLKERLNYFDILLTPGLFYALKAGKTTYFNVGVTYQPTTKINTKRFSSLERRNPGTDVVVDTDTLNSNVKGSITLPSQLGFGLSLEKYLKYTVGVDFSLQDWSEFRNFDDENDDLQNSYRISVGGEFIPNISSIDNYFDRVKYRAGMNYQLLPYTLNGKQISSIALNIGTSFPVFNYSSLDFALEYGERGTTQNGLIKESYFRIYLGATINDRWFVRRRYD